MALSGTPTPKCLTLAEAKRHLNIEDDFTDDDQYIESRRKLCLKIFVCLWGS